MLPIAPATVSTSGVHSRVLRLGEEGHVNLPRLAKLRAIDALNQQQPTPRQERQAQQQAQQPAQQQAQRAQAQRQQHGGSAAGGAAPPTAALGARGRLALQGVGLVELAELATPRGRLAAEAGARR